MMWMRHSATLRLEIEIEKINSSSSLLLLLKKFWGRLRQEEVNKKIKGSEVEFYRKLILDAKWLYLT